MAHVSTVSGDVCCDFNQTYVGVTRCEGWAYKWQALETRLEAGVRCQVPVEFHTLAAPVFAMVSILSGHPGCACTASLSSPGQPIPPTINAPGHPLRLPSTHPRIHTSYHQCAWKSTSPTINAPGYPAQLRVITTQSSTVHFHAPTTYDHVQLHTTSQSQGKPRRSVEYFIIEDHATHKPDM